jgi:hypothetical protein
MGFRNTIFRILDEMTGLVKKDLLDFLQLYDIHFPEDDRKDRTLDSILKKTRGEYEAILEELKNIEDSYWSTAIDDSLSAQPADADLDYN